jgi:hypothetical protein
VEIKRAREIYDTAEQKHVWGEQLGGWQGSHRKPYLWGKLSVGGVLGVSWTGLGLGLAVQLKRGLCSAIEDAVQNYVEGAGCEKRLVVTVLYVDPVMICSKAGIR